MTQPKDINLGKGWFVRFYDGESPVYIEYKTFGASLGYFEENYGTSIVEHDAPQSVIDKFEANADLIYEWEADYFKRNPR